MPQSKRPWGAAVGDPRQERGLREFSQVLGAGQRGREVELGAQQPLQAAAHLGGWVVHGPVPGAPTSSAGLFLFPGLEALHKKTAPGCSTYLKSVGQDVRARLALAMLGGIPKNPGMERGGGRRPSLPSADVGLGSSPSAATISTSFCCVLYMGIFISCLMLCRCGLSTSEETVF